MLGDLRGDVVVSLAARSQNTLASLAGEASKAMRFRCSGCTISPRSSRVLRLGAEGRVGDALVGSTRRRVDGRIRTTPDHGVEDVVASERHPKTAVCGLRVFRAAEILPTSGRRRWQQIICAYSPAW